MSLKKINIEKENVIFEARIESNNDSKVYIGLTENQVKKRIAVHKTTFKIDLNEISI